MAFDAKEFLADVLSQVPEDKRAAVEEAIALEPVAKHLESSVMRQSEFSRKMDELAEARKTAEAEFNQQKGVLEAEKKRYADWYAGVNKEYDDMASAVERYREEYGELDGDSSRQIAKENPGMTKEEVDAYLAEQFEKRDRQAIKFADVLTDIKLDHQKRFDEKLDTTQLFDHVEKSGLRLDHAYEDMIRPRVEEAEKVKFDEQLKQAREEGRKEALSEQLNPVQPDRQPAHSRANLETPTTSDDRVAAAVAAYNAGRNAG